MFRTGGRKLEPGRWATDATLPWTADRSRTTLFFRFTPQGTAWSAEYFDAAGRTKVEVVELTLAIGQGQGDAVE